MRRAICEHAKKACMRRPAAAAACKKACSCQRSCPLHHASPAGLSSFASSSLFNGADHLVSRFSTHQNNSEGPLPTDFSSLLDEKEFHKLADELLDYLQEKIDELGEQHDIDGFDIDHAEGVLTIKLGTSGTYVINKQTPNRQIWLSSPVSGPARFDWDVKDCCWVYRRTKSEILQLLEKEIHELLGSSINLSK